MKIMKIGNPNCLKIVTINIPVELEKKIEEILAFGVFPSRSELIRCALHEFIKSELAFIHILKQPYTPPPPPTTIQMEDGTVHTITTPNTPPERYVFESDDSPYVMSKDLKNLSKKMD